MDLRIQKTKAAIKSAFLELRKKKPVEKITVTELSRLAEINKATFYLHYSDIYSLTDEMEDEAIDDILSGIQWLNKFFDDPKKYSHEIFHAFMHNRRTLNSLFSGSRHTNFSTKIEERIKARLYAEFPRLRTKRNDIVLSFMIQGAFHTVASSGAGRDMDAPEELEVISRLTDNIISELDPPAEN